MKLRPDEPLPRYMPPQVYNLCLDADSYKSSHFHYYRDGTTTVYSYIEPRGGRYPVVMFAGLQALLYSKLGQPLTWDDVNEARDFLPRHGMIFNEVGWAKIMNVYGGRLPLRIRAIPEGTVVPVKQALFTIENLHPDDPDLFWLTSYLETMILRDLWTACTIATRIYLMATRINKHWDTYSDTPMSPFALLDFSSRGVMGYDHSLLGGTSYLFMFQGSDNMPAVRHANYYYFSDMAGFSLNATEHSIACAYGRDNDDDYIDQALDRTPEDSGLSLVGDTWNIFKFAQKLVLRREKIINKRIKMICRPDSGEIGEVLPPVFATIAGGFGTMRNSKGMEVINFGAAVLQGDGMNEVTHMTPFEVARDQKIAPDSAVTAAGGGLMTADLDRDTMKWAMKCSEQIIGGERIPIVKDPITDPGKKSKSGRFALITTGFHGPNGELDAHTVNTWNGQTRGTTT